MLTFSNAKINLGLNVVGEHSDGYHDIESCLYPVALSDILEIVPSGDATFEFSSSGLDIPGTNDENLCVKAFRLLKNEFEIPGVRIHLHKMIPVGSGLGGGSSNAAFTIKTLNKLFALSLSTTKMMELSSKLGSDCPFFIDNVPCIATGRGERLNPIKLKMKGLSIVIITPPIHVSTKEAYGMVNPRPVVSSISSILFSSPDTWNSQLVNDFEESVFKKYPLIKHIKKELYSAGAIYASMSGSGSSIFGIFISEIPELRAFSEYKVWEGLL